MSKPLLSIFADGLRNDSLRYMPFVSSLNSVPLKTVLGYSITCHPSMYTGLYPDKHKIAFHWVQSENKRGPYCPLSFVPNVLPFSNPYVQAVLSHFYAKFLLKHKSNSFMNYGKILHLPMKFWNQLDINEFKYWDDDNYINKEIKTIFELIKSNNYRYHISGMYKPDLGKLEAIKVVDPSEFDWVYYFIGELDTVSHNFTQHSNEGRRFLLELDQFIEKRFKEFERSHSSFTFVFWSDHGHIPIEERYNLFEVFKSHNCNLNKYFHIVDSTTARFWVDSVSQHDEIKRVMEKIVKAHLLKEDDFRELHLSNDSRLYGDICYYLDGGAIFTHTIHGFGLKTQSMHGYHPEAEGNDGVFVSNRSIKSPTASLPDVFSTSIHGLEINYNSVVELDGKNILS